jgi:hypothetical protein
VPKTIEKIAHTPGEAVHENEVPATCEAEGSYDEVLYCTVCGEELSRKPKTIEKLDHNYVLDGDPTWTQNENGVFGCYFFYVCSECGYDELYTFIVPTYTEYRGERHYTAEDEYGSKSEMDMTMRYSVKLNGVSLPQDYAWGEICVLTADELQAWYLNSVGEGNKLADGVNSYTFAVTTDTEIVTTATEATSEEPAAVATIKSETAGTASYDIMWSLPSGATVNSVTIYRGANSTGNSLKAETLMNKGAKVPVDLTVRNGNYNLSMTDMTSGKWQHVVTVIDYTLGGEQQQFISNVVKVQIK